MHTRVAWQWGRVGRCVVRVAESLQDGFFFFLVSDWFQTSCGAARTAYSRPVGLAPWQGAVGRQSLGDEGCPSLSRTEGGA